VEHATASELVGVFCLDACDADEAAAFEVHLAGCDICAEEANRLRALAGWIGVSEVGVAPGDLLRQRILREALNGEAPKIVVRPRPVEDWSRAVSRIV
jgi:anti-sigma factor RsiW